MTEKQKNIIIENHNLIYKFCYNKQIDIEEYYGDLAIALCKSAISYNKNKGNFSTYVYKAFNCAYINAKNKNNINNIDIDNIDIIDQHANWFENNFFLNPIYKKYKDIIDLLIMGYTQNDVARKLGLTQQSISKKIKKIRKEILNEYINKNN